MGWFTQLSVVSRNSRKPSPAPTTVSRPSSLKNGDEGAGTWTALVVNKVVDSCVADIAVVMTTSGIFQLE